jgi:hypothetical protein
VKGTHDVFPVDQVLDEFLDHMKCEDQQAIQKGLGNN